MTDFRARGMGKVCLKCGYERRAIDVAPDYECPRCQRVYAKVEAAARWLDEQDASASPPPWVAQEAAARERAAEETLARERAEQEARAREQAAAEAVARAQAAQEALARQQAEEAARARERAEQDAIARQAAAEEALAREQAAREVPARQAAEAAALARELAGLINLGMAGLLAASSLQGGFQRITDLREVGAVTAESLPEGRILLNFEMKEDYPGAGSLSAEVAGVRWALEGECLRWRAGPRWLGFRSGHRIESALGSSLASGPPEREADSRAGVSGKTALSALARRHSRWLPVVEIRSRRTPWMPAEGRRIRIFAGSAGYVQWLWHNNPWMASDNEAAIGALRCDGSAKPEYFELRDALGVLPAGSLSWRREPLIRVRLRLEPVSTISRTGSALPPSSRVTRPSTTGRLFSTVRGSSTPPPGCAKASGSWSSTRRDAGSISTT